MPVVTTISPTQSDAQTALGTFLMDILGVPATQIVAAQSNRVPEPKTGNFVVMTAISFERQATNLETQQDVRFTGSISGNVLTVTAVQIGQLAAGLFVVAAGVTAGTTIQQQTGGTPGGAGTYQLSASMTVGSETMSAGSLQETTTYFLTIQLDFHSADYTAAQWAQTFATLFRSTYATTFFSGLPAPQNTISPLYATDATQRPFLNAEQQYEWRWVVDAKLQIDQTVTVPQTYADSAQVVLFEVP